MSASSSWTCPPLMSPRSSGRAAQLPGRITHFAYAKRFPGPSRAASVSADVERLAALGVQGAIGARDECGGVVAGVVFGQSHAERVRGECGQHAFGELEPTGGSVPGGAGKYAEKLVAAI